MTIFKNKVGNYINLDSIQMFQMGETPVSRTSTIVLYSGPDRMRIVDPDDVKALMAILESHWQATRQNHIEPLTTTTSTNLWEWVP